MELFQKLGNMANKTCKKTSETTNKFAIITKLKWQMSEDKSKIDKLYVELGKVIYENRVREQMEDTQERIEEKCKEIDELADRIEMCRKKILKYNNKKQCPKCYTEIASAFNYCPNCGTKQTEEDAQEKNYEPEEPDANEKIDLDSYIEPDKLYTEGEETKKDYNS